MTLCCNLVVEDKELGIFRFPHQSVREYLETRPDYSVPEINAVAAQICLSYLTKPKVVARHARGAVVNAQTNFDSRDEGQHNLHDYATLFWLLHLQHADNLSRTTEISSLIASFLLRRRANPAFASWMNDARALNRDSQWKGYEQTQKYRDLRKALDDCFCEPPNPWFLACVFGLQEVIEKTAPPTQSKQNENGLGLLHLACRYHNSEVVRQLLNKGEDLNSKDIYGHTPLFHAVPDAKIAKILFERSNELEVSEHIVMKAISDNTSSGEERVELLDMLLKRGGRVSVTEDMIEVAGLAKDGDFIEWLLDQDASEEIMENVFKVAANTASGDLLRDIHEQEPSLKATPDMLCGAAAHNNEEALVAFLEMFDEPRIPVEVLQVAAYHSSTKILDIILQEDPEIEIPQDILVNVAVNHNDAAAIMDYFLRRKPDLDVTSDCLASAAANSIPEQAVSVTKFLLAHDPTLEINEEVLRSIIKFGNRDMLRFLLDRQPSLQISQDLVELAAGTWWQEGECTINLLLERNPCAVVDMDFLTVAARRVDKPGFELCWNKFGQAKATQDLLIAASSNKYPEVLEFLLHQDPNIFPSEECFQSLLKTQSSTGKQKLDLLLKRSKDFVPSEATYSAAIQCNNTMSVYFLGKLKTLAPTEQTWKNAACFDDYGWALSPCIVLRILWSRGLRPANATALVESAARSGNVASVKFLLEQNAIEGLKERWLPIAQLTQAVAGGSARVVRDLLDKGIEPDTKSDVDGRTPLLIAARMGDVEAVAMLLKTNAVDIEAKEFEFGRTPLLCAISRDHTEVVKLLLEKGADKSVRDIEGKTPYEIATEANVSDELREMLL